MMGGTMRKFSRPVVPLPFGRWILPAAWVSVPAAKVAWMAVARAAGLMQIAGNTLGI